MIRRVETGPALRAIIYLRRMVDYPECEAWCKARRYRIYGVILDRCGQRYSDALSLALAGECEVIIVRRLSDLPPDRVPRTEVVDAAALEEVDPRPRRRRPRPRLR